MIVLFLLSSRVEARAKRKGHRRRLRLLTRGGEGKMRGFLLSRSLSPRGGGGEGLPISKWR